MITGDQYVLECTVRRTATATPITETKMTAVQSVRRRREPGSIKTTMGKLLSLFHCEGSGQHEEQ
jgi:hypothetical protein